MSAPVRAVDERPHRAEATSAWSETWEFRVVADDASLAVMVSVVLRPAERQASYWCAVMGRGRPTLAVVEHEIVAPRGGLELRASGIWADHICETPLEHWSIGLEAFGLIFDDPSDAVTSGRGLSAPIGLDLEWETPGSPRPIAAGTDAGYVDVGRAHGEVLFADEVIAVDGRGHRLHRWGTGPSFPAWWSAGDRAGTGAPPWTVVDEVGRAVAPDEAGSVTAVSLGVVITDCGAGEPGWSARHGPVPVDGERDDH